MIGKALPPVVRNRNFRSLWIGQTVSQFGDALYYLVFIFIVDQVTHDPETVGGTGALMVLPWIIFGFHAGVAADRFDRRKVMLLTDIISAGLMLLMLLVVIFQKTPHPSLFMAIGFSLSAVAVFFDPARAAAIPALVKADELIDANSLSTSTKTLMQLFGPLASAFILPLLANFGRDSFLISAVSINLLTFAVSAYCIFQLPRLLPGTKRVVPVASDHVDYPREGEPEAAAVELPAEPQKRTTVFQEFLEGLHFVRGHKVLRTGIFLTVFVNLLVAPILVLYTTANRERFEGSAYSYSGMQIAFFIGMAISSVIVMKLKITKPGLAYLLGLMGVGATFAMLAYAYNFWIFFGLNFLCGLVVPFAFIPVMTMLQLIVPDALRGRVMSTVNMLTNLLLPLGWYFAGVVIKPIGTQGLFVWLGVGLALTGAAGLFSKEFRTVAMPTGEDGHTVAPTPVIFD